MSGTVSSGNGLKLDNERDHVFVQPFSRVTCIAKRTCSADRAYIVLNHLRSAAQNLKDPDSEGLASTLVQTLEPARDAVNRSGC
jgi:hypothetical protein